MPIDINSIYIIVLAIFALLLLSLIIMVIKIKVDIKAREKDNKEYFEYIIEYQNRDYEHYDKVFRELSNTQSIIGNQLMNMKQDNFNAKSEQMDLLNKQYQVTEDNLNHIVKQFYNQQNIMEQKQNSMRELLDINLNSMRNDNENKLEQIRATVEEKLNDTLNKRLTESFSMISERLETVYKSLGEMQGLSTGVEDLRKMLTNVKKRGIWGELQLGMLLEQVLSSGQYEENVSLDPNSSEKVEFAICIPTKSEKVYLPIDSKFPQESYRRLISAYQSNNDIEINNEIKALNNAIKTEAKRISTKYIVPPYTTDFAIMFLPVEGLYAEVVKQAELIDVLHNSYRVVVCGPTTLLALLNSLQLGFKSIAIEQHSHEIRLLLGQIKMDFNNFAQVLQQTQQKLHQASDSIDFAFNKTKKIQRRLEGVETIDNEVKNLEN